MRNEDSDQREAMMLTTSRQISCFLGGLMEGPNFDASLFASELHIILDSLH